jgi:hypothetical protein
MDGKTTILPWQSILGNVRYLTPVSNVNAASPFHPSPYPGITILQVCTKFTTTSVPKIHLVTLLKISPQHTKEGLAACKQG